FRVLDPLMQQGELPTFKRIAGGARGSLMSKAPLISPAIWTSIITGRVRADHGITDFRVRDPKTGRRRNQMVSSAGRETLALWSILGGFGKSVGAVGWWASWPAE